MSSRYLPKSKPVDILVSRHPTAEGLVQQVSQKQLGVLFLQIGQVLFDEFTESQMFVQLAQRHESAIGGDSRFLGTTFKRG